MSAKFFLDTNVLVYTFDGDSPKEKSRAQELVEQALRTMRGR
jgi:predicted nucleic acid-binding protein